MGFPLVNPNGSPHALEQRGQVLWIGLREPHELRGECAKSGWELGRISVEELAEAAPTAHAVVLELQLDDPGLVDRARRVAAEGLTHGLAVILAYSDPFYPSLPPRDKLLLLHDTVSRIQAKIIAFGSCTTSGSPWCGRSAGETLAREPTTGLTSKGWPFQNLR